MKTEEFFNIVNKGESDVVEFKSSYTKDIAKDICAFANTEGGILFIGINDNGELLEIKEKDIEQKISDAMQSITPSPKVNIDRLLVDNRAIFIISADKSSKMHSVGNIAYIRVGRNNRPLSINELIERSAEVLKINFDDAVCPDSSYSDINKEFVKYYLNERKKVRGIEIRESIDENMRLLKIIKQKTPTNAGILFFSDKPQDFIPNSKLRLVWFIDETMTIYKDQREFEGPIWKIIDDLYDYFLKNLARIGGRLAGFKREEFIEYPIDALREAVINSIIHRNYFDGSENLILITPRMISIRNPGGFPPGVTPEDPIHKPRNNLLSQYMFDLGYIEKYGMGIKRMKEICGKHPLVNIAIKTKMYFTEVNFIKEKEIPEALNESEKKLITLIEKTPRTSTEIAKELGITKQGAIKKLKKLIKYGFVDKEGIGKNTVYKLYLKNK